MYRFTSTVFLFIYVLAANAALAPRASPNPNCDPNCPSTYGPDEYPLVFQGTYTGYVFCEYGPDGEYTNLCTYNVRPTRYEATKRVPWPMEAHAAPAPLSPHRRL
jgi:hypothetical protein